jgi:hypothetical protein
MRLGRSRPPLAPGSPLRSFALGGLVGAAGAFATVRRLRASQAAGLAAFEDAPCFLELLHDHAGEAAEAGGER